MNEVSIEMKPMQVIKHTLQTQNEQGKMLIQIVDHVEGIEQKMNAKYEETSQLLKKVSDSITLNYEEQNQYKSIVSSKSHDLAHAYFGGTEASQNLYLAKVGQIRTRIYVHVKKIFNVPRYSAIKRLDLDEAIGFVRQLELRDFEEWEVRMTPRQKELSEEER